MKEEKRKKWLLKCQGTTRSDCGAEERLLHRRRNGVGDGHGLLADEVDDWLGESVQEDVHDLLFEGGKVMHIENVREKYGEEGGGESSENRETVNPK
jgi:hypothetical protein